MFRRLSPLLARHPLIVDAGLALITAVIALSSDIFGHDHRPEFALAWDVLLAVPLVLRRRAPIVAAVSLGLLCLAQWLSADLASGDLAVLVMLYSLGAWERRLRVLACAVVVAELGVVMAVARWDPDLRPWRSVLLLSGTVTASWVIGCYVRMRRDYLASTLARAETAERERDSRARIAVVEERARMAREMHDIIAHSLSVMITLNDAVTALATDDTVRTTATQASGVGRQALAEMQRLLGVLRSDGDVDLAPQPGTAQLTELVAIVRSAGPATTLTVAGEPAQLATGVQLAIYRIVQESLTNVLKHAGNVTRVDVELKYGKDLVTVRVRNDGDVVEIDSASDLSWPRPGGHGVIGMQERAGLYGGRVSASPAPAGGWVVTADLPMPDPLVVS